MVDGLKDLPEAINAVFPQTTVQTCIVHLIRNNPDYAGWKDRKLVAATVKPIYAAANEQQAREACRPSPMTPGTPATRPIVAARERTWEHVVPFFIFPPDIRRVIYTTNAIENVSPQLRKIVKSRVQFLSDEAAVKLLWLALRNVLTGPSRSVHTWKAAMNRFAILFGERCTEARD